jgi:RNA polymerase sigma-70 factor (ECF subfamily)
MWLRFSKNKDTINDDELIIRYKNSHDTKYIGILFERYSHLVFGTGMKYLKDKQEAKDITLIVFEKLITDLKRHNVSHFKSWLYMVTKNQCLMQLRKNKRNLADQDQNENFQEFSMENEQEMHLINDNEKEIQLSKLEECIAQLKPEQKTCTDLFFLQEKCYNEIAEITGYALIKVKSYLQNAKRNLIICMAKKNEPRLRKI